MAAPVPLAMIVVDEILLDVIPTTGRLLQGLLIAEMLPEIEPSYDILSLNPPMEVVIHMTSIRLAS